MELIIEEEDWQMWWRIYEPPTIREQVASEWGEACWTARILFIGEVAGRELAAIWEPVFYSRVA